MNKFTKEWVHAALIRAIRTFCQVAVGYISVGMALRDVDWIKMFSVSIVASIYSIITSIATNLPELDDHV